MMGNKPAWVPVFWDDWLGDTQDLSLLEHGAYFRLMAAYYANGGWLPADRRRLYRLCGALEAEEQEAIDLVVARYFGSNDSALTHERADKELARIADRSAKARAAAERRHSDESADAHADAGAHATATAHADAGASGGATRAHGPQPTSQTPEDQNPENPSRASGDAQPKRSNGASKPRTAHRFDEFWRVYPRKKDKAKAREAWKRKHLDERADTIIHDVEQRQRHDHQWIKDDGKFIPLPTTYLRNDRWEDEFTPPPSGPGNGGQEWWRGLSESQ